MRKPADPRKVAAVMAQRGRVAALERNPAVQARFEKLFRANGWHPEEGRTALGTLLEYARKATETELNGRRLPFEERWDRTRIATSIANRTRGIGSPRDVMKLLDQVLELDVHDGLQERLATSDLEQDVEPVPQRDEDTARAADDYSRRATLERLYAERDTSTPTPTPTPAADDLHGALEAAFDAHEEAHDA